VAVPATAVVEMALGVADALRKKGDFPAAIQQYGDLIVLYEEGRLAGAPEERVVAAYLGFARANMSLADYDAADKLLAIAAARFTDPELHMERAVVLDDLGRIDEARSEYVNAEPGYRKLALGSQDPDVLKRYGRVLSGLERYDEAKRQFELALELYQDRGGLGSEDAELLSNLGFVLDELDRHADAVAAYERSLGKRPEDYVALYNRAVVLDNMGDATRAEAAYRAALEKYPNDSDCNAGLGWVLDKLKRFIEARASCQKALQLQETNASALLGLGYAEHHLGKSDAAEQAYRASMAQDPSNPDTCANLAALLLELDRVEEAYPLIVRAVKLSAPKDPEWPVFSTQAAIEVKVADKYHDDSLYRDAIEDVKRANRGRATKPDGEDPERATLELTLSNALTSLGDFSKARAALRRASRAAPTSPDGLKAAINLRRLNDRLRLTFQAPRWLGYVLTPLALLAIAYGVVVQGLKFDSTSFVGFVMGMLFVIFAAFSLPAITRLKIGPAEFDKSSGSAGLSSMDKS
jgi:tetratricopeptide (TPR) repeat protein